MRLLRGVALVCVSVVPIAGCALFADFGGLSGEGDPAPATDAASSETDAGTPIDGGTDTFVPPIDAGPDAPAYRQAVLADQPIAYWPMDEAAGANVAVDIVGGKNADVIGAITFGVAGVSGTAIERKAGGGRLDVGDFFDLAGKTAYAIEFWGWDKGTSQFEDVLSKRGGDQKGWWVYFRNETGTSIQIEQRYAAGSRTTYAPVPNAKAGLRHIVFVFDPTQPTEARQRVYIDSVRTDGFSDDGDADDVTAILSIASGFVGVLDEVAIYDHVLTASRVAEHFKLGPK